MFLAISENEYCFDSFPIFFDENIFPRGLYE